MDQLALFDIPPAMPAGFTYRPDMLTAAEEAQLVAVISALPFTAFEFHGYTGKRRVPARSEWEHSIPGVDALRYSITFRNLKGGAT